jgi:hypothetical protein
MRTIALTVRCLVAAYFISILYVLATRYAPGDRPFDPPFLLFVMDTINLFIHEAGHLFTRPFGQFICVLGGSLVQVLLPLALLIVTWRKDIRQTPPVAFWVGESMINVSVYIADAPYRKLKLIASGLIHDWWWLLNGDADIAEPLSWTVYGLGYLLCTASVVAFVVWGVMAFREAGEGGPPSAMD